MFEKLISEVLNKVLGEFIENIDPNQLNISISTGKVRLENMKLKKSMFDSLPLPFALAYGQIGVIDLTIPVWNMFNSPLVIMINNIFAYVKPKQLKDWSEEVEQKSFRSTTQNLLEQFELFHQNVDNLKKKDPSTVDKLVNKIIDNIQVTIKNLYIRYEDECSAPHQGDGKFVVGILLKEISANTTDTNWKVMMQEQEQEITYKLAKIKNFTMFLDYKDKFSSSLLQSNNIDIEALQKDKTNQLFLQILTNELKACEDDISQSQFENQSNLHNYIIDKFSLEARIQINKSPKTNNLPQIDLNLLLGGQFKYLQDQNEVNQHKVQIKSSVKQPQIIRILKLLEFIGFYNEFQQGALSMIIRNSIPKDAANQYISTYVSWKAINSDKKQAKKALEIREEMKKFEDRYPFSKLVTLRKYGLKLQEQQEEQAKDKQEYERKMKEMKELKKSGWFTSKEKKAQNEKEIEEFTKQLQQELSQKTEIISNEWEKEMDTMQEELQKSQGTPTEGDFNKMPENYIRFKFRVEIASMRFTFSNEFNQQVFVAEIEEQLNYIEIAKSSMKAQFSLKSLALLDRWSGATTFPQIIETKESLESDKILRQATKNQFCALTSKQALLIKFETGKNVSVAPFKAYIETQKTLYIVANLFLIQEIQRTLMASFSGEKLDFSYYKETASEKAVSYINKGKELLETLKSGAYKHQQFDVRMNLRAPVIIVPENVFQPGKSCAVIDVGFIQMQNKLQKYEDFVDYKLIKSAQQVFDQYEINLSQLQVKIIKEGLPQGVGGYKKEMGLSLVKDFNLALSFYNCLNPFHPDYPTAEIVMVLKNIDVTVDLPVLGLILQLQNTLLDLWENKDFKTIFKSSQEKLEAQQQKEKQLMIEYQNQEKKIIEDLRKKANEEKQAKKNSGEDDEFFDCIEEDLKGREVNIDEEVQKKKLMEEEKAKLAKKDDLNPSINIYFLVDRVTVNLFDDVHNDNQKTQNSNFFINQQQMLLSSPEVEAKEFNNKEEVNNDIQSILRIGTLARNSLVAQTLSLNASYTLQEDEDDEFKDALDEEEYKEQVLNAPKKTNEFEFSLYMSTAELRIKCFLSDMRLIFSMPTLQRLVKLQICMLKMFEDLEIRGEEQRSNILSNFDYISKDLKKQYQSEDQILIQKIMENQLKVSGQEEKLYLKQVSDSVSRLIRILGIAEQEEQQLFLKEEESQEKNEIQNKVQDKKSENQVFENVNKEEREQKLSFEATLNNFSVWIPLKPKEYNSPILNLSFMSMFNFSKNSKTETVIEQEFNHIVSQKLLKSEDNIKFSINRLVVSTLTFFDQEALENQNEFIPSQDKNYQQVQMLEPCRINIKVEKRLYSKTEQNEIPFIHSKLSVEIEPLHLKLGYSQIDFANLFLVEIHQKILQQFEERAKEIQDMIEQNNKSQLNEFQSIKRKTTLTNRSSTMHKERNTTVKKKKQEQPEEHFIIMNDIQVVCELVTLALTDDSLISDSESFGLTNIEGLEQELLYLKIQDAKLILIQYDDKGNLQQDEKKKKKYMRIEASTKLLANYYNQRTLSYEPFLEPYSIQFKFDQETASSEKVVRVTSSQMFNLNLTYGLALTLRKIKDRIEYSQKQAQKLQKFYNQRKKSSNKLEEILGDDEDEVMKKDESSFLRSTISALQQSAIQNQIVKGKEFVGGYLFFNYTGLSTKFALHDEELNEDLELQQQQREDLIESEGAKKDSGQLVASIKKESLFKLNKYFQLEEDNQKTVFKSFDELNQLQQENRQRKNKGRIVETLEEEPLKIDFKINQLHKLKGIPIEGLGIYSYEVTLVKNSKQFEESLSQSKQQEESPNKKEESQKSSLISMPKISIPSFGFGKSSTTQKQQEEQQQMAQQQKEEQKQQQVKTKVVKKDKIQKVGVIVNIKMEGKYKKVQIESQVLIANNLNRSLSLFVMNNMQKPQTIPRSQRFTIESNQSFRLPLSWLIQYDQYSLFIEGRILNYLIFKDIGELFTSEQKVQQKLSQIHSQIFRLDESFYTSMDISGYECLPKAQIDGPLQYLISFNSPLVINNLNFSPLEVMNSTTRETLSLMGPKESTYINQLNTTNEKYNITWRFYEHNSSSIFMETQNFYLGGGKQDEITQEKFVIEDKQNLIQKKDKQKYVFLEMDLRKQYYEEILDYDNENFSLREKKCSFISSYAITFYPKFMLVNKNSIELQSDSQTFSPYSSSYLNIQPSNPKVSFKIPGYKFSQGFAVQTVGLSGCFDIETDKVAEIQLDKMPQNYVAQKVEYGIKIQSAPNPYGKTTLITVVPRYILVNKLHQDIVIRQKGLRQQILLKKQEQVPFNFEQKAATKQLTIRDVLEDEQFALKKNKHLFPDMVDDKSIWSPEFSIEDIEDFQVSYSASPNLMEVVGKEPEWYDPKPQNNNKKFIRVIITTMDDATILVVFSAPLYPEYEICNKSDQPISYAQSINNNALKSGIKTISNIKNLTTGKWEDYIVDKQFIQMKQCSSIPYVWQDRNQQVKKLVIQIDGVYEVINMDKALKRKVLVGRSKNQYEIQVRVTGNAKKLRISNIKDSFEQREENGGIIVSEVQEKEEDRKPKIQEKQFRFSLKLQGIGVSVIDEVPREILFFSVYNISVEMAKLLEQRDDGSQIIETIQKLKLSIDHLQLDNMLQNSAMPVILAPSKPLVKDEYRFKEEEKKQKKNKKKEIIKQREELKKDPYQLLDEELVEEITPFIQINISVAEGATKKNVQNKVMRIRGFQFQLQEFIFKLDTSILNTNVKFTEQLVKVFTNEKSQIHLGSPESFSKSLLYSKEKYCNQLETNKEMFVDPTLIQTNKIFMELIHLGAIKSSITIKIEKKAFEFDVTDPKKGFGAFSLVYSLMATAASISNSNFQFKELILIDLFVSKEMLVSQLTKNYARQGVLQFYKLLGSSDLIGNPIGLVDKLGTGVFEFFSEPKKGLLQGPEEFVGGIGNGVKSLVTNVLSGGFDSISKMSGSLYTVVKGAQGESNVQIKKPDHVFQGIYQGVTGGASEIGSGIKGVFTKPVQGAKEKGVKGFVGGVGSGLFGAVTAPVTATLRFGNSIAQGVSSTATSINEIGKDTIQESQFSRFRPPRYINIRNVIKPYDEEQAMVYQILATVQDGHYANSTLKFFCQVPETKKNGELINQTSIEKNSLIVVTDEHFLYIKIERDLKGQGIGTLLYKTRLFNIDKCEVYDGTSTQVGSSDQKKKEKGVINKILLEKAHAYFILVIHRKGSKTTIREESRKYKFVSEEYSCFEKIYDILSLMPECQGKDEVRKIQNQGGNLLECCTSK